MQSLKSASFSFFTLFTSKQNTLASRLMCSGAFYLPVLPYWSVLGSRRLLDGQGVDRRERGPADATGTVAPHCHWPVNGAVPSAVPSAALQRKDNSWQHEEQQHRLRRRWAQLAARLSKLCIVHFHVRFHWFESGGCEGPWRELECWRMWRVGQRVL